MLGIAVDHNGATLNIRARKAVIIGTGGSTGNVNFRRMFDPRLTEEYCGLAGMPWSDQDASGELAAMAIGASLWGLYNQTGEFGSQPHQARLDRLPIRLPQPAVDARQPRLRPRPRLRPAGSRTGRTSSSSTCSAGASTTRPAGSSSPTTTTRIDPYVQGSYLNAKNFKYNPNNFLNAALAGIDDGHNGGGPIWAIFDADAVAREKWHPTPPQCRHRRRLLLQRRHAWPIWPSKIVMKYQRVPMPPANLEETVARYNSFVDFGVDEDFGKPKPLYKIAKPPFYAAWATPVVHDTRAGLRINAKCQVIDMNGEVIPGLYCGGESAGGFSQHGLARAACQGYIAGTAAAALPPLKATV